MPKSKAILLTIICLHIISSLIFPSLSQAEYISGSSATIFRVYDEQFIDDDENHVLEVKDTGSCTMCHPDLAIKPEFLEKRSSNLAFSHNLHLEMEIECIDCHDAAQTSTVQSDRLIPVNPFKNNKHTGLCAECHDAESVDDCMTCHTDLNSPSSLFSTQTDLVFSHSLHVEMDVECQFCHESILVSDTIVSSRLPEMSICAECHEEVKNNCIMCHKQIKSPRLLSRTETFLNFSHKFHIEEGVDECVFCHEKVEMSDSPDMNKIPKHEDCFQCHHEEDYDNMLCIKCHRNLGAKDLKPITRFSHEANYVKRHKDYASKDNRQVLCAQCHKEEFCMDCHSSKPGIKASEKHRFDKDRFFIHRGDFQSRHHIDARRDGSLCLKCHRASFCQDCHSRKGFALDSGNQYDVHPSDFLVSHGRAARRDILTCAVCHDRGAATSCIECHAISPTGTVGPGGAIHIPRDSRVSFQNHRMRHASCAIKTDWMPVNNKQFLIYIIINSRNGYVLFFQKII